MSNGTPSMLKPALIGGLVFGVAAAIPFLNLINCVCCALILGSGFLAAYMYSNECKTMGAEFRPGKGALVGLTAAPFYAVANAIVGGVVTLIMGDASARMMAQMIQNFDLPPEQADMIERMMEQSAVFSIGGLIIGFVFALVFAAIFSTLGGLIGGAVFKNEPPVGSASAGSPPPPTEG